MKTAFETGAPESEISHSWPEFLVRARVLIDQKLDQLVPAEDAEPVRVHQAIRWSLLGGGKRFRPTLALATGETLGAPCAQLLATGCAFEMIHTYSLIHDDLPSMDNDQMRRGRATCHVRFDEATAILAGDALQAMAFETIAADDSLGTATRVLLLGELARAAGTPHGMVAGQALDLAAESGRVTEVELPQIHRLKTGALIVAAARSGAVIAGAVASDLKAISEYGAHLGLLFQITDDLLDVTATASDLGKTPGKDAQAQKATYPAIYGVEAARDLALQVHRDAVSALRSIDRPTALLTAIADFILARNA